MPILRNAGAARPARNNSFSYTTARSLYQPQDPNADVYDDRDDTYSGIFSPTTSSGIFRDPPMSDSGAGADSDEEVSDDIKIARTYLIDAVKGRPPQLRVQDRDSLFSCCSSLRPSKTISSRRTSSGAAAAVTCPGALLSDGTSGRSDGGGSGDTAVGADRRRQGCGPTPLAVYNALHNRWWRRTWTFITFMQLGLGFFEYSAYADVRAACFYVELVILFLLCVESRLWHFCHDPVVPKPLFPACCSARACPAPTWFSARLVLIALTVLDMAVWASVPGYYHSSVRVSRLFRSFFLIERGRVLRKMIGAVADTLSAVFEVVVLIAVAILSFAFLGYFLFSENALAIGPNPNFADFEISAYSMTILITTANFPDVMMASYTAANWTALFFIIYLLLALYLMFNLILAAVYTRFQERAQLIIAEIPKIQTMCLCAAFELLVRSDPVTSALAAEAAAAAAEEAEAERANALALASVDGDRHGHVYGYGFGQSGRGAGAGVGVATGADAGSVLVPGLTVPDGRPRTSLGSAAGTGYPAATCAGSSVPDSTAGAIAAKKSHWASLQSESALLEHTRFATGKAGVGAGAGAGGNAAAMGLRMGVLGGAGAVGARGIAPGAPVVGSLPVGPSPFASLGASGVGTGAEGLRRRGTLSSVPESAAAAAVAAAGARQDGSHARLQPPAAAAAVAAAAYNAADAAATAAALAAAAESNIPGVGRRLGQGLMGSQQLQQQQSGAAVAAAAAAAAAAVAAAAAAAAAHVADTGFAPPQPSAPIAVAAPRQPHHASKTPRSARARFAPGTAGGGGHDEGDDDGHDNGHDDGTPQDSGAAKAGLRATPPLSAEADTEAGAGAGTETHSTPHAHPQQHFQRRQGTGPILRSFLDADALTCADAVLELDYLRHARVTRALFHRFVRYVRPTLLPEQIDIIFNAMDITHTDSLDAREWVRLCDYIDVQFRHTHPHAYVQVQTRGGDRGGGRARAPSSSAAGGYLGAPAAAAEPADGYVPPQFPLSAPSRNAGVLSADVSASAVFASSSSSSTPSALVVSTENVLASVAAEGAFVPPFAVEEAEFAAAVASAPAGTSADAASAHAPHALDRYYVSLAAADLCLTPPDRVAHPSPAPSTGSRVGGGRYHEFPSVARAAAAGSTANRGHAMSLTGRAAAAGGRRGVGCCESLRSSVRATVREPVFEAGVDLIVFLHAVYITLHLEGVLPRPPMLNALGAMLLGVYTVEVAIKVTAFGPARYWAHGPVFRLDLLVVLTTMVLALVSTGTHVNPRLWDLPLLRVFRIIRHLLRFAGLRAIISTVKGVWPALRSLIAVLFSFFYFFATLGVFLFRGLIVKGEMDKEFMETYYANNNYWENNFNDLAHGLVTLFEIMIINNWNLTVEGFTVAMKAHWPRLFFVSFFFCTVVILMNVVVALLLEAFVARYTHPGGAPEGLELDSAERDALTAAMQAYSDERAKLRQRSEFDGAAEGDDDDAGREDNYATMWNIVLKKRTQRNYKLIFDGRS